MYIVTEIGKWKYAFYILHACMLDEHHKTSFNLVFVSRGTTNGWNHGSVWIFGKSPNNDDKSTYCRTRQNFMLPAILLVKSAVVEQDLNPP